jgi:transglutaminase-like putative cysteine protease
MTARDRVGLAGFVAVLLASSAILPIYDDRSWFLPAAGVALSVALGGMAGRRLRVPAPLQPLLSVAVVVAYVVVAYARTTLEVVVPTEDTITTLHDLIDGGANAMADTFVPVPTERHLVILAVLAVGAVAILVEAVAATAGRAALAGAPLLLLYAGAAGIVQRAASWWSFALAAAGWLLVVLVESGEQRTRWGAPLRSGRRLGTTTGQGSPGTRIGLAAAGLALVVPLALPSVGAGILQNGFGTGAGDGSRTVTTYNPITRLRGDLTLPNPVPVLRYETTASTADYLRMTTLSVYDGNGWRQDTLNGNLREDGVDQELAAPIGRAAGARTQSVRTTVTLETLRAYWLPAPATPSEVEVDGPWLWDRLSESIFSTRATTRDVDSYTVVSLEADPTIAQLRGASTSLPDPIKPFAKPIDATDRVEQITAAVIAGKTTAYDKAVAIQDYFQGGNGFVYDERTTTGSSPDALQDFLENKRGFCEQYSSAMAAMLRLSGIPARVAVGFTPGARQADGSYLVTTSEAHAWPEAWFAGVGWVRFEPTPSTGYRPDYAQDDQPGTTGPSASTSAAPSASASTSATPGTDEQNPKLADQQDNPLLSPSGSGGGGGPWGALGLALVAVLLVLGLPAATAVLRRRHRWRVPTAQAAWEQLCDDASDVGLPVDPALSPRQARDALVRQGALSGSAAEAVRQIASAVERDRYARPGPAVPPDPLARWSREVRAGLLANLSSRHRLRIRLLPASTLRAVGVRLTDLGTATGARWEQARGALRFRRHPLSSSKRGW